MLAFGSIVTIIAGIVIIVVAIVVLSVAYKVKNAVAPIFELAENMQQVDMELEMSPKSVSAMTSVYLPRIEKDFPEFSYQEFKARAEDMMRSSFAAISASDISLLVNASTDLKNQISNRISSNDSNHLIEKYSEINVHRTEIKNYVKNAGNCVITLQSAVGYVHYVKDSRGEITKGSETNKFQTRYDIDLMYIQDVSKTEGGESFTSNNCPHCGAPIKGLGAKSCPYCGSGVEEINIRTWAINRLTEV